MYSAISRDVDGLGWCGVVAAEPRGSRIPDSQPLFL
jgi:hypothetical protein